MNKLLTRRFAIDGLLLILSLVVLFHLLVIVRVIPFDIVWGGKLKNVSQMRSFEAVSVSFKPVNACRGSHACRYLKTDSKPRDHKNCSLDNVCPFSGEHGRKHALRKCGGKNNFHTLNIPAFYL